MLTIRRYRIEDGESTVVALANWALLGASWLTGSGAISAAVNEDEPEHTYRTLAILEGQEIPANAAWEFVGAVAIPGTDGMLYVFVAA